MLNKMMSGRYNMGRFLGFPPPLESYLVVANDYKAIPGVSNGRATQWRYSRHLLSIMKSQTIRHSTLTMFYFLKKRKKNSPINLP